MKYLLNSLNDKEEWVREAATKELAKLGKEEALQPLLTFLKKVDCDLKDEIIAILQKSRIIKQLEKKMSDRIKVVKGEKKEMAEEELIEDLEDEFQIIQIIHNEIFKHWAEIEEYLNDLVEEEELEREHANHILTLLQDFLMKLKEHAKEASKRGFSDFDEDEWYSWVKRTFQPYAKIGGYIDIERFTKKIASMLRAESDMFLEGIFQSLAYQNY